MLALLVGCPGPNRGGGSGADDVATFRVFYPDQPAAGFRAQVGKRFQIKPVASCTHASGRDARWTMTGASIDGGGLPPGLAIEDGAIGGVPSAAGTYDLKVRFSGVTCAGEAHDEVVVDVKIAVAAT